MRYFGGDDEGVVDGLIRCIDGELDLRLGELIWPTAFEPPSDARPVAIVTVTYFLEVKTLTCQLDFFDTWKLGSVSGGLNSFG